MSICGGIAGQRGHAPWGVFIHNDDGSINATADTWARLYATGGHDLNKGFVHAHADSVHVVTTEDDENCAWHCGSGYYNTNYLSIEVDQSRGADDDLFLKNENNALKWAAEKCKLYGIIPNSTTIMLHREVYATDCPARSLAMHGGTINSCKAYFIEKIWRYILGNDKGELMEMTFAVPDDPNMGGIFYFDGSNIKGFANMGELTAIKDIYKLTHDGKELPHREYTVHAPFYLHLMDFCRRKPITSIEEMRKVSTC